MRIKIDQLIDDLKEELGLLLSISFGLFLFVLFFQPFPFTAFDINNTLLFVGGLGAIVFILMALVRITIPWIFKKNNEELKVPFLPPSFAGFIILTLSSVAFAFYLHYVGFVSITFFIMSKVVLICFAPAIALGIYDTINNLKQQNELLIFEKTITTHIRCFRKF